MSKTRKSSRRRSIHIDLSDIRLDTTCVNIVPGGLPLSTACEICKPKLDIHTKRSSQKSKKERQKHPSNRCKQYWTSKWGATRDCSTSGNNVNHVFTRQYLNINQDVEIEYDSYKNENLIYFYI